MAIGSANDNKIVLELQVGGQAAGLSEADRQLLNNFKESTENILKKTESDDILLANGQTLSREELKGDKGDTGERGQRGERGVQGQPGERGADGKSAYQLWIDSGNQGAEQDFLNSLKGAGLSEEEKQQLIKKGGTKNILLEDGTTIENSEIIANINKVESITSSSFVITTDLVADKDFRIFFQEAVKKYNRVILQNGTYNFIPVAQGGVVPKNGTEIYFEPGAKIKVAPNALSVSSVIDLVNTEGVTIWNPVIEGDKYEHLNNEGIWFEGILIRHCSNVRIYNAHISKMWGLGITMNNCRNVRIFNSKFIDNRRQGISIHSCKDSEIHHCLFKDTKGHNPGYGINIEPNFNGEEIELKVFHCEFDTNGNAYPTGFAFSTHQIHTLKSNQTESDLVNTNFNVLVESPIFINNGLFISAYSDRVFGNILVRNPIFKNTKEIALRILNHQSSNFQTTIENPKFYNCCTNTSTSNPLSPIAFLRDLSNIKHRDRGTRNVTITNAEVYVSDDFGGYKMSAIYNDLDTSQKADLKNVIIENIKVVGYDNVFNNHRYNELDESFRFSLHKDSNVNILKTNNFRVQRNYIGSMGSYRGDYKSPTIYLDDSLSPSGLPVIINNLSSNKEDLTIKFGSQTNNSSVNVYGYSTSLIKQLILPYNTTISLQKNGNKSWRLLEFPLNMKNDIVKNNFNPETIDVGASKSTIIDFSNVIVSDFVQATFSQYHADLEIKAVVSDANKVTVFFKNVGQSPITIGSGEIKVRKL